MSAEANEIDGKVKQHILNLDLSTFVVEPSDSSAIMDGLKATVNSKLLGTIFTTHGLVVVISILLGLINLGFFIISGLSVVLAFMVWLTAMDTTSYRVFHSSALKEPYLKERELFIQDRVSLLEIQSGGICQFTPYINISKFNPSVAEAWATVLKQSFERQPITDVETYLDVLKTVKSALKNEEVKDRVTSLDQEIKSLILSKKDHAI